MNQRAAATSVATASAAPSKRGLSSHFHRTNPSTAHDAMVPSRNSPIMWSLCALAASSIAYDVALVSTCRTLASSVDPRKHRVPVRDLSSIHPFMAAMRRVPQSVRKAARGRLKPSVGLGNGLVIDFDRNVLTRTEVLVEVVSPGRPLLDAVDRVSVQGKACSLRAVSIPQDIEPKTMFVRGRG